MKKKTIKSPEHYLNEALNYIKSCPYKGTAIKIELEAELYRGDTNCGSCDGQGYTTCDNCDGDGGTYSVDGILTSQWVVCDSCRGTGEADCGNCDGQNRNFSEEDDCEQYILGNVSTEARQALIYSKFYNDGSVDSEFTFTLPLGKAKLAVEFIRAFKNLSLTIGNGLETEGAGMHIAVLNSEDGNYPEGNRLRARHAENFSKSMTHLLPALFFLGSADHHSRALGYRYPCVNVDNKHSAISGGDGSCCFEYRVFETCYDQPERIFDFICVIAKTLRFYKSKRVDLPFFGKIGKFGFKDGYGLERLYYTRTHLEALRAGVEFLKPDYKTFQQLRKERNFKLTFKKVDENDKKREYRWRDEWRSRLDNMKKERLVERAREAWERHGGPIGNLWTTSFDDYFQTEFGHLVVPESQKVYVDMKKSEFMASDVATTVDV